MEARAVRAQKARSPSRGILVTSLEGQHYRHAIGRKILVHQMIQGGSQHIVRFLICGNQDQVMDAFVYGQRRRASEPVDLLGSAQTHVSQGRSYRQGGGPQEPVCIEEQDRPGQYERREQCSPDREGDQRPGPKPEQSVTYFDWHHVPSRPLSVNRNRASQALCHALQRLCSLATYMPFLAAKQGIRRLHTIENRPISRPS